MKNKVLQAIKINEKNSLFICGFDAKTNKLKFRTSYEPKYLQEEVITIVGENVKTNLYFFHINYLKKFLNENK